MIIKIVDDIKIKAIGNTLEDTLKIQEILKSWNNGQKSTRWISTKTKTKYTWTGKDQRHECIIRWSISRTGVLVSHKLNLRQHFDAVWRGEKANQSGIHKYREMLTLKELFHSLFQVGWIPLSVITLKENIAMGWDKRLHLSYCLLFI